VGHRSWHMALSYCQYLAFTYSQYLHAQELGLVDGDALVVDHYK
jgi:hypothetical protein